MNITHMLDMSDVGLGNLTEYRLLVLMGNYHSLSLVYGLKIEPDKIIDSNDKLLYPAYYKTHIKAPLNNFIESYALWEKADISVNVKRFGSNILESLYTFDRHSEDGIAEKNPVTMESNSLFVLDATIDKSLNRTSSVPKTECISNLEKLKKLPPSIKKFKEIRNSGFENESGEEFTGNHVFLYKIKDNVDVSHNHGVIFAKFTEIMDMCEYDFLFGNEKAKLPNSLLPYIHLIDRETYYYCNCFAGDTVECQMSFGLENCQDRHRTGKRYEITPYFINESFELYNKYTHNVLVISKAKKLICLPIEISDTEADIYRILSAKKKYTF